MALARPRPDLRRRLLSFFRAAGLFQGRCCLCGELAVNTARKSLCGSCADLLAPRLGGFCPLCGEMDPSHSAPVRHCKLCQQRASGLYSTLPWQGFCFYAPYAGVLRAGILAYKMRGRLGLGALLQELMLHGWRQNRPRLQQPDLIVPVPLHPKRLRLRGFNQSVELARPLARELRLPLACAALRRTRPTQPQFQLEFSERARNIRGAFAADASQVAGADVLLVDDIMTTGATLEECGQVLQHAGAARVEVIVLARTARP